MIVSITCRHGTEARIGRNDIGRELMALSRYVPTITRAQAVFSKETHHKNSDELVTCHLSIHIPNRRPIDIYEHQPSESQAFDKARERVVNQMARCTSSKSYSSQRYWLSEEEEISK